MSNPCAQPGRRPLRSVLQTRVARNWSSLEPLSVITKEVERIFDTCRQFRSADEWPQSGTKRSFEPRRRLAATAAKATRGRQRSLQADSSRTANKYQRLLSYPVAPCSVTRKELQFGTAYRCRYVCYSCWSAVEFQSREIVCELGRIY